MLTIRTPATSANIGPGFDCLGLALAIYNTFTVEKSDTWERLGADERFPVADDLFLTAYRKGCGVIGECTPIHVRFDTSIPACSGLGSSASLICAGLAAAGALHGNALSRQDLLTLSTEMEGHPDNVAPCILGGLVASANGRGGLVSKNLPIDARWRFTVLMPDFEISTEEARRRLPPSYTREEAVQNAANAILVSHALSTGDLGLILSQGEDRFHEPYRKGLIADYERIRKILESSLDGRLFISGSGPTLLFVSQEEPKTRLIEQITKETVAYWRVKTVPVAAGMVVREEA
ncbi:MAG: homoserine kinase [Lachnospiraceae bacterium]|nr:homoserine kinase [Lachnospiraceae bacterium]